MAGGILMMLGAALVIAQVTRGQALQRLGILGPAGSGGLFSGVTGQAAAAGSGIGAGLSHFGGI